MVVTRAGQLREWLQGDQVLSTVFPCYSVPVLKAKKSICCQRISSGTLEHNPLYDLFQSFFILYLPCLISD